MLEMARASRPRQFVFLPRLILQWKRMRSGDRPGLQNRRVAGNPVTGGFDPHSLPPVCFQKLGNVSIFAS